MTFNFDAPTDALQGVDLRVQQTRPVVVVESDETVLALERDIAEDVVIVPAAGAAAAFKG